MKSLILILITYSIVFTSCWDVGPKNFIEYDKLSHDQSLDYRQMLKEQIDRDKKKDLQRIKKDDDKYFKKYYTMD